MSYLDTQSNYSKVKNLVLTLGIIILRKRFPTSYIILQGSFFTNNYLYSFYNLIEDHGPIFSKTIILNFEYVLQFRDKFALVKATKECHQDNYLSINERTFHEMLGHLNNSTYVWINKLTHCKLKLTQTINTTTSFSVHLQF